MDTTKVSVITQNLQSGASDICSIYWMYTSYILMAVVLVLVFILLVKTSKKSQKTLDKEKIKGDGKIDFEKTLNGMFQSSELYDSLIKKCHPDRFVGNEELQKIATELTQKLTESRYNHTRLLELKKQAMNELNINL